MRKYILRKQKTTTNSSEPDANGENGNAQNKSDRRLDGANRRGMRYTCFSGEVKFVIPVYLFVGLTFLRVWVHLTVRDWRILIQKDSRESPPRGFDVAQKADTIDSVICCIGWECVFIVLWRFYAM